MSKTKIIILVSVIVAIAVIATIIGVTLVNNGKQIDHISVSSRPNDVEYYVGQEFDAKGILVQVVYNNGESEMIGPDQVTITGFDSSQANDNLELTVSYQGFISTFTVKIKDYAKPVAYLKSIELCDMPKTTYTQEEWQGMRSYDIISAPSYIKCIYSDGTSRPITLTYSAITGLEDINGIGVFEIVISYAENGILLRETIIITITE